MNAMKKIRVLIADDHPIVRKGLRELLKTEPDMEVVEEAGDGKEALEMVRSLQPDVLLLDIVMPGINGLEAVQMVREASPRTGIVVLTMHRKDPFTRKALQLGVLGFLYKGDPCEEIPAAIRSAHGGRHFLNSAVTSRVVSAYLKGRQAELPDEGFQSLSGREQQVFLLLIEGNSTSEIGQILCISPKTVEKYRLSISNKMGLQNPTEMLKYAIQIGLVDPELWKTREL